MSTMNAWHQKASPRVLFAAIDSCLFVAALALLGADAMGDDECL